MTAPDHTHSAPAPTVDHAHVADLAACLDLINSIEYTDGIPEDHIPSLDDAVTYFAAATSPTRMRSERRRRPGRRRG